jgi:hypothetical protein
MDARVKPAHDEREPVGWVERQRNPSSCAETRGIVGRIARPIACREVFPTVAWIERSEIRVQQSSSHGAKRMRNSYHNSAPDFAALNPGYAC